MHHVIQKNLFNEFGFRYLIEALELNKYEYTIVNVIPFSHELTPDIEISSQEKVMVWGSLTLDGIAKERGWKPGSFQNENFDMRILHKIYGDKYLNSDAVFCAFAEMNFDAPMFCRPVHDTKTFSGSVIYPDDLKEWKERIIHLSNTGYSSLRPNTPVMYASSKKVDFEARFFIVDGKVITGSTYRNFGEVMYQRVEYNNPMFHPMLQFAEQMVAYWSPIRGPVQELGIHSSHKGPHDSGFVLDIASINGEYKVIEINCLNSSGFYLCDMNAVVRALENSI